MKALMVVMCACASGARELSTPGGTKSQRQVCRREAMDAFGALPREDLNSGPLQNCPISFLHLSVISSSSIRGAKMAHRGCIASSVKPRCLRLALMEKP